MSRIPNFSTLAYEQSTVPDFGSAPSAPWITPEDIAVKDRYEETDRQGLGGVDSFPGMIPFLR